MVHRKFSASPPYFLGSSLASITGRKAVLIAEVPLPTTFTFAKALAEINGLYSRNIQIRYAGTLT